MGRRRLANTPTQQGMLRAFGETADFFDLPAPPREADTLILSKLLRRRLAPAKPGKPPSRSPRTSQEQRGRHEEPARLQPVGTYSIVAAKSSRATTTVSACTWPSAPFSVFWEATCQVSPRRCCIPEAGSESGFRERPSITATSISRSTTITTSASARAPGNWPAQEDQSPGLVRHQFPPVRPLAADIEEPCAMT